MRPYLQPDYDNPFSFVCPGVGHLMQGESTAMGLGQVEKQGRYAATCGTDVF